MGKKKRQFIDKKKAQKFSLVHRSQRDPLQADEDSAQHVLVPADGSFQETSSAVSSSKEENLKYGVLYDDDYDYMQHLKSRGEGVVYLSEPIPSNNCAQDKEGKVGFGTLLLPSEALPSKYEEDEGMLSKGVLPRGPRPDWDPDIVAAFDDDVDFDDPVNMLEDDFMKLANSNDLSKAMRERDEYSQDSVDDEHDDHNDEGEWETDSEGAEVSDIDSDNLLSSDDEDFNQEETKSRFTNYSMTSSVIRRSQGLKTLDDRFEKIMEEYDEDYIGCIDHDEVTGTFGINNDLVTQIVDEFIDQQKKHDLSETKNMEEEDDEINDEISDDEKDNEDELFVQFIEKPKEKCDCESIISTYSNIYNHPKLIVEERNKIQLHKRTGIPAGVLNDNHKKEATVKYNNEEVLLNSIRNKNETVEEKRLRKQEVKKLRRNRRAEKKDNKVAFKSEFRIQEKVVSNAAVQKGIKM